MDAAQFASELAKYPRVIRSRATYCGSAFRTTAAPRVAATPSTASSAASSASAAADTAAASAAAAGPTSVQELASRRNFWDELHETLVASGASEAVADRVRSTMRLHHRKYIGSYNLEDIDALCAATSIDEE